MDYFRQGPWGEHLANTHYTALAWMISHATKGLNIGQFTVIPEAAYEHADKPVEFSILPQHDTRVTVEMCGRVYDLAFQRPSSQENGSDGENCGQNKANIPPSIIVTPWEKRDVAWFARFIQETSQAYKQFELEKKQRGRWELDENGNWFHVLNLHSHRGLDAVSLDRSQQLLLRKDVDTFVADQAFYRHLGLPYRRGYLFHGKPGTGKTSLVQAIAAELGRDLYYLNLRGIKSDAQLQSAFSRVPEKSVIVFEDIDAMSKVTHRRDQKKSLGSLALLLGQDSPAMMLDDEDAVMTGPKTKSASMGVMGGLSTLGPFTLSALLNCLDGHIMEQGNIVIMTTNYADILDPALIRPGRIDLQLELGYCTQYQIRQMYSNAVLSDIEDDAKHRPVLDECWLATFPEYLVPPCDAMRVMILFRREAKLIPAKLDDLVLKYSRGGMSLEEEEELCNRLELAAIEEVNSTQSNGNSVDGDDTRVIEPDQQDRKETERTNTWDEPATPESAILMPS